MNENMNKPYDIDILSIELQFAMIMNLNDRNRLKFNMISLRKLLITAIFIIEITLY